MNSLIPPHKTSFFYNLYSFQDISDSHQQTPYIQPFVVQNRENPSIEVNSLAMKNLSQNPLKRKREEGPVKKHKSIKIPKLENLDERISRFGNLNEIQKREILNKHTSLITKYYKGFDSDQIHTFISQIDNEEKKLELLAWIKCMRMRSSIIKRALEMMSEDPNRFNTSVRKYISITPDLADKTTRFSRYITDVLRRDIEKKYSDWKRSIKDECIHCSHVEEHIETRLKLQGMFEYSNETKQNDLLINNIYTIIEITYSPITENVRYSFEEIKKMISSIPYNDQLVLLKWMLYCTRIETVRLINYLTKYGLPLDDTLLKSIENLTYTTKKKDLNIFRQIAKRREVSAVQDLARYPSPVTVVSEDIPEIQPIEYPALQVPEQPCYETQYPPLTSISPAHNFQMHNPYFQFLPPCIEQNQTFDNYMSHP